MLGKGGFGRAEVMINQFSSWKLAFIKGKVSLTMKMSGWWSYLLIGVFLPLSYAQSTSQEFTFDDGTKGSIDWSAGGLVQAQGIGFPVGSESFAAQEEINACRAARVVAQSNLLQIIQGVSIYGGITVADKNLVEDTVETRVEGVLRGAQEVIGSKRWEAEQKKCELVMAAPLDQLRDALPPLGIAEDGKLIVLDAPIVNLPTPEESEATEDDPEPAIAEPETAEPTLNLVAQPDAFTIPQGSLLSQNVLTNDAVPEGTPAGVVMVGNVTHGTLTLNGDGSFTYQHSGEGPLVDYFKYKLGGEGSSSEGVFVTINIEPNTSPPTTPDPNNHPPIATDDQYVVVAGESVQLDLFANDTDSEGNTLTLTNFGVASNGTLKLYPNGTGTYTPHGGDATSDSFTYYANDGQAESNQATVYITIQISATPSTPAMPTDIGGPDPIPSQPSAPTPPTAPVAGPLPTGIILDASAFPLTESLRIAILRSGQVHPLHGGVEAYYADSVESARQEANVGPEPEVLKVSEIASNSVDIVLDEETAARFIDLILQKDFVSDRNIVIVGGSL